MFKKSSHVELFESLMHPSCVEESFFNCLQYSLFFFLLCINEYCYLPVSSKYLIFLGELIRLIDFCRILMRLMDRFSYACLLVYKFNLHLFLCCYQGLLFCCIEHYLCLNGPWHHFPICKLHMENKVILDVMDV